MKVNLFILAMAASAFGSLTASAQTTIIEERRPGVIVQEQRPVVIQQQRPVVIEQTPVIVQQAPVTSSTTTVERGGFLGTETKQTTETVGTGPNGECATRTVRKQDLLGEKTITRTDCN